MRCSTSTASASAPLSSWRLALLVAVLAGFFLMHGSMAGDSCADVPSTTTAAATAQSALTMSSTSSVDGTVAHATGANAVQDCGCSAVGTACTPLRPQSAGALLALVLAAFAWTPLGQEALLAAAVRLLSRRASRAAPVRALACVSRT